MVDIPSLPPEAFTQRSTPSMQKAFVLQAQHFLEQRWVWYGEQGME